MGLWVGRRPQLWHSRLGLERGRGTRRLLGAQSRSQGRGVGGSRRERLATGRRRDGPESRRPAPGGLLLRPSSRLRAGGRGSVSGAAAGTVEQAARNPPSEDLLEEKRERGGSGRQLRGQASGRGPWSSVLRPALLARVRDLPTLLQPFFFFSPSMPPNRVAG